MFSTPISHRYSDPYHSPLNRPLLNAWFQFHH
ncbi:acyltransferase family domain protein [Burkholderia mallei]|nr:acyltransferase family domain protein [Burkholderia mallei]